MIDEVFPGIFRIEVPLPANPLRAINSYVVKGDGRCLIIDTGMNRKECRDAMNAGLKELEVDLQKSDFFITHLHADHLGLVSELAGETSKVYFSRIDAEVINNPGHWERMMATAGINGFPELELEGAIQKHPGRRYQAREGVKFTFLKEGDKVAIGQYVFCCIETPGHSPGHICLYEPSTKIFFAGDHILEDITPNISMWFDSGNPLQSYIESLDKIGAMEISQVFPGHRRSFTDYRKRIVELKRHHELRAQEILAILQRGSQSVYRIASSMTWDIDCKSWEEFPVPQKWFASGEARSHLHYLEADNKVRKDVDKGKILFSLAG